MHYPSIYDSDSEKSDHSDHDSEKSQAIHSSVTALGLLKKKKEERRR